MLLTILVGRDFTVLLLTENATHQLGLIKTSPRKQSNHDANIQNAWEHTLFSNGGGQENMIQFVFGEADILL